MCEIREQRDGFTKKFIEFIFSDFQNGFVEFRYVEAEKRRLTTKSEYLSIPLIELDKTLNEMFAQKEKRFLAFGPAPRRFPAVKAKKSGSDANIAEVGCIWSDLSYGKTPGGIIETIERIGNLPLRPSVVTDSGYGRQIYYVFNEPLKNRELLTWKKMIENLTKCLEASVASLKLGCVLPIPGTNIVRNEATIQCAVCDNESSWLRYPAEEIETFLTETLIFANMQTESRSLTSKPPQPKDFRQQ